MTWQFSWHVQATVVTELHSSGGAGASGAAGAAAAVTQGFLSQQQQHLLMARHIGQPLGGLPLNRLTQKQSQQVMGQWHARQPDNSQPVIHHARRDAPAVVTTSGASGRASPSPAVAAGSFASFVARDTVSPSPSVRHIFYATTKRC